jgi:D-alanyl-D-alanine dipeptidase
MEKKIIKLKYKNTVLKMVNLKDFGFLVEPRYYFYGWSNLKSCYARQSVTKKLLEAKKYLPKGYNFKIWDGFRTKETQRLIRISFRKRLENLHSDWNSKVILKALNIFAGPPIKKLTLRLRNHFTGGSLDLTIVNKKGEELDMGTDFDDCTEKAVLDYYEKKKTLNWREKIIKKNRRLLKRVMKKAGFLPYLPEWWHWSYNR